jgi:hypothetical protein
MFRKLLLLSITLIIAISSVACSLSSSNLSAAEQRVENYNKTGNKTNPDEPKELKTSFDGETIKNSADKAQDGTEIPIASMNEKVTYDGFDVTVENAWKSDDLTLLEELESDSSFKDFMIRELNYGDDEPAYDDNGKCLKRNSKWIFLKVKMTNHNDDASDIEYCMNPYFYNSTDEKNFKYAIIESCGFDKYKEILDITKPIHQHNNYYTFEKDEELETIIVFSYLEEVTVIDNLYMSVRFLTHKFRSGYSSSVSKIPSGCPMIKIEFDN